METIVAHAQIVVKIPSAQRSLPDDYIINLKKHYHVRFPDRPSSTVPT